ncbi:MAG TPA: hypothetical protein VKA53_09420 [Thermoanaerobaculia bacterium]|nr:hypothetical protein [Thermoanaerobaculia bacterium]
MEPTHSGSLVALFVLVCSALVAPAHATCAPDANSLCLQGGLFEVSATWSSDSGPVAASATPLSGDQAGIFSFFGPENPEVTVKTLDFRKLYGTYLVFTGGASDLGWQVTVRNTETGDSTVISSPAGSFSSGVTLAPGGSASAGVKAAFGALTLGHPEDHGQANRSLVSLPVDRSSRSRGRSFEADLRALFASPGDRLPLGANHTVRPLDALLSLPASGACTADETTLCLQGGRFEITLERADGESWIPAPGEALTGDGAGLFHFFSPDNPEVTIKVLDFRPLNGRFLVLYDGTTNLGWRAHLRNTATGDEAEIDNPAGSFAAGAMLAPGPQQVAAMIGPAGGVLSFPDGSFKLTIPPGALAKDTQMSVAELAPDDFPAELQVPSVRKVYDLQPDGLEFAMPATVEIHTDGSPAPPGSPLIGLISDSHGTLELLGPLANTVDGDGITASAPVSHFSRLATLESRGYTVSLAVSPDTLPVNEQFQLTLGVTKSSDSGALGTVATKIADVSDLFGGTTGVVSLPNNFDPPSFTVTPGVSQELTRQVTGTCEKNGVATLAAGGETDTSSTAESLFTGSLSDQIAKTIVDFNIDFALSVVVVCRPTIGPTVSDLNDLTVELTKSANEAFSISGISPLKVMATSSNQMVLPDAGIFGAQKCAAPGECTLNVLPIDEGTATVTVTVTDANQESVSGTFKVTVTSGGQKPPAVSLGNHTAPGGSGEIETASLLGPSFAGFSGGLLTLFSDGSNGYVLFDLTTDEVKRASQGPVNGLVRGAVPISAGQEAARDGEAIIIFGTSDGDSSVDNHDPITGQWTSTPIPGSGSDASQAGNSLTGTGSQLALANGATTSSGAEVVLTQLDGVHFIAQSGNGSFALTSEMIPATSLGGNGGPISAFETTKGGPVLVASIAPLGSSPPNGSLYFWPRHGAPSEVGKVGVEPRRIRCLNGICGVTNNTDNSLTILLWDGTTKPTIAGTTPVGDGPVGLDLATLSNGDTVIGTTGYNDNTYTLTEVAADGSVVSSDTKPVDAGCYAPSHLAFFADVEGLKALVTCYYTSSFDVLQVEATP